jgi:hypothetical protein
MKVTSRLRSLDAARGVAIAYVIFIHGVIYNLYTFGELDIKSLAPPIIALGVVGLWGGVFVVYSLMLNTMMVLRRLDEKRSLRNTAGFLVAAGGVYLGVIGSIQSLILGRWPIGSEDETLYTYAAQLIRGFDDASLHLVNLMSASGIKTIGLGLLVTSLVLMVVLKQRRTTTHKELHLLFMALGVIILGFSFLRIYLYEPWLVSLAEQQWILGYVGGLFLADPYPGIAYLSYGFFGVALAIVLHYRRTEFLYKFVLPIAATLITVGIAGIFSQPLQFFGASWFWYFKILFESGCFLLIFSGLTMVALHENRLRRALKNKRQWLRLFSPIMALSRISLTAYLLEMVTSELLRYVWFALDSDWDKSLLFCSTLAITNVAVWLCIAVMWRRANYKYSLEYFWVKMFAAFGKQSTKLGTANVI